jgi:hypothetical protein
MVRRPASIADRAAGGTTSQTDVLIQVDRRVNPSRGVKQGCPLSPLLFAFLISDMGEWMQKPHGVDLPIGVPLLLDSLWVGRWILEG